MANYLPNTLTILSTADLSVVKVIEVADRAGHPSRVSAVYQAPERKSFVLALKDAPEIWEIATDPGAGPFHDGFVHSHRITSYNVCYTKLLRRLSFAISTVQCGTSGSGVPSQSATAVISSAES